MKPQHVVAIGFMACTVFLRREARAQTAAESGADTGVAERARVPDARLGREHGLSLAFAAGANYAKVFSVPTYGEEFSIAVGGRSGHLLGLGGVSVEHGHTEQGLTIWGGHLSGSLDYRLGAARLGVAARIGDWSVERATAESSLLSGAVGIAARAGVDFLELSDDATLFAQAELRCDVYGEATVLNPNLSLGFRWDPPRRRR